MDDIVTLLLTVISEDQILKYVLAAPAEMFFPGCLQYPMEPESLECIRMLMPQHMRDGTVAQVDPIEGAHVVDGNSVFLGRPKCPKCGSATRHGPWRNDAGKVVLSDICEYCGGTGNLVPGDKRVCAACGSPAAGYHGGNWRCERHWNAGYAIAQTTPSGCGHCGAPLFILEEPGGPTEMYCHKCGWPDAPRANN